MAIKNKIISFWKQVKLKSSDMFTLFRVGIGVKVPTHKLHVKDAKDPLKIEGLQNDTTDPDKYLTIDSSNIVKYRKGSEVLSDIIGASTDFTMDDLTVDTLIFTGEDITTANDDFNITLDSGGAHSDSIFSINSDSSSNYLFRITEGAPATYSFKRDTDAVLVSEGNMTFRIDGDADEIGQSFTWQNNSSTEIASLTEAGAFTTKNIILGDADDTDTTVIKTPSTDANGGDLTIISGDGAGTNRTGGDLVLRAGDSTGNAAGGSILFKSTPVGSSGSSANATTNIVEIDNTGNLQIDGDLTVGGGDILNVASINSITDLDMLIISDGNISFRLDNDNDETGQSFSFNNYTTEIANLDESGNLQIDGGLTTGASIIYDGDRSTTPGDGAAIHVDASDITDNNTSASGTATAFNHVNIENPRVLASNASVTTTTASTVYIKGAPVASTNQTITNAYALNVAGGNSKFGGNISSTGTITGKMKQMFHLSFHDDLGTTKHWMPWGGTLEQSGNAYQEEVAMSMPYGGRIVSCLVRSQAINSSGTLTIGIETKEPGALVGSSWTSEETESLSVGSTDANHAFHFVFDNASHFEPGDLVAMSIQSNSDLSNATYWYVTTVVEFDLNDPLGTTSAEYDSNP